MPPTMTRTPNSLPNLTDNRSDYSVASRATVSTTAARGYHPQLSHHGNKNPYSHVLQDSYDLNGVSANFVIDLKNDKNFQVLTSDGYGLTSARGSKNSNRQGKWARRTIGMKHTPSMLLPDRDNRKRRPKTSRVEGETDDEAGSFASFISSLRQSSVVPNDPDKLPIIIAPRSQTTNSPLGIEDLMLTRSNSSSSLDSLDGSRQIPDTAQSTLNNSETPENDGEYIDTFSDNNDIAKFRWGLLRSRLKAKRMRKKSRTDQGLQEGSLQSGSEAEHSSTGEEVECPICAKAAKNLGGKDALISWILDKLSPKRNLFPRYNSITRGTIPHFCNFVKKVKLNEKENERPQPDHSHLRHRAEEGEGGDISSNPVQASSSQHGSHDDIHGRPCSPASTDRESHDQQDTTWPQVEELKSEPVEKDMVGHSGEGHDADTHAQDGNKDQTQRGGSEGENPPKDVGDQDQNKDKITEEPAPPSTVNRTMIQPPPSLNKPSETRNSPYPHQNQPLKKPRAPIVKKEKKPFERQRQMKQETEVVETKVEETPAQPEVKEEVKVPSPPPTPKPVAKVPDLPSFRDKGLKSRRKASSSRSGRQGIRFMSPFDDPDADKETLENMKDQRKAFELTVPETSKEEFLQKPRIQSWLQARLALSQQSSRFELPMDVKTLEKMTGQDYLKKHCVISTRRSALYHKVHSRYKEKGGLIHVKDLDKALQDVLVNTITSEDTRRICELVGLDQDGSVDFKLFAGIAAMAERMLYPKFVTDDTSEMKEFKKETIECADFSALDWKLHGINVNPQVHTILKCL